MFNLINFFKVFFLTAICVSVTSCSNNEEIVSKEENKSSLLMENEKFSCYLADSKTRSEYASQYMIKVKELPGYTIHFAENNDANSETYKNKSIFVKDNEIVLEVYSNVEETETGWIFKYKCIDGDEDICFFPKNATRSEDLADKTLNCIEDAYNNHGWASILLYVESAFIPVTAVVIAGDCLLHNL